MTRTDAGAPGPITVCPVATTSWATCASLPAERPRAPIKGKKKQKVHLDPNDKRPVVDVAPYKYDQVADEALSILHKTKLPIFQRGDKLVRVCVVDGSANDDQHKSTFGHDHAGNMVRFPTVPEFDNVYLERVLNQHVCFVVTSPKDLIPIWPPEKVSKQILRMSGDWKFPVFKGIATVPFLTPDGRLIKSNGIDIYISRFIIIIIIKFLFYIL